VHSSFNNDNQDDNEYFRDLFNDKDTMR